VPGLAVIARVSTEECRAALATLSSPDPDSRTKEHEGRRIREVDGGWLLLNYAKYRAKLSAEERRSYMRDYMQDYRKHGVNKSKQCKPPLTQAEAEAEAEAEVIKSTFSPSARIAVVYLREKSGHQFRECDSSLRLAQARLNETGVDIDGVKKMIDRQCALWGNDPKMCAYLRPSTLFGKEKFESYYAQRDEPVRLLTVACHPQENMI
jgi:uncharacterized phage protein (TIGR02220 family)